MYYSSEGGRLYRLLYGEEAPELIQMSVSYCRFSHDGMRLAYWEDDVGLWLSDLDHWQPELVFQYDRRLSYNMKWMPDDSRVLFKVSEGPFESPDIIPENTETLAYNLKTQEVEPWPWGECTKVVRHRQTQELSLVCTLDPWSEPQEPEAIVVEWGGDFKDFEAAEYVEVFTFYTWLSSSGWSWQDRDWLLYFAPNPEYNVPNNYEVPTTYLYIIHDTEPIRQITPSNRKEIFGNNNHFALSPDHRLLAYWASCFGSPYKCLEVRDIETNSIVWSYEENISLSGVDSVTWLSDNQHIVMAGGSTGGNNQVIQILNIETDLLQTYEMDHSVYNVTITEMAN